MPQISTPLFVDAIVGLLWATALYFTVCGKAAPYRKLAIGFWGLTLAVNTVGVIFTLPGVNILCLVYLIASSVALTMLLRSK